MLRLLRSSASTMKMILSSVAARPSATRHAARQARHAAGGRLPALARPLVPAAARPTLRCMATATAAPEAGASADGETFTYQAEVDRLMDLIVNSLYSNKDIFLRELVSNASDALDKARFMAINRPEILAGRPELEIRVRADTAAKTVVIEDSGCGMTKAELVDSLGTIARSGTSKFREMLKEAKDAGADGSNLIGKFGVGFYSAFLVADRVTVDTKSPDDDTCWRYEAAAGAASYKIRPAAAAGGEPLARGTRITLHLKEDASELSDGRRLGELIKTYSEFIQFPISLWTSRSVPKQVEDAEATAKAKAEAKEGETVAPVMKTEYENVEQWAVQNDAKPLWMRAPKEVAQEDYDKFFKASFKEFIAPLAHAHFAVEGSIEFRGLLFVPGMAPFQQDDFMKASKSLKLYVRRVFISDEFEGDLLPRYLGFIKGIVDSDDLPLNVSREILQESRVVRIMRKQLLRKALDMIKGLAEKTDDEGKKAYETFWGAFGKNLKLGCIEDAESREELAKLLRFPSSASGEKQTSLAEYVARMKPGQPGIFYLAADSKAAAEKAPFLEGVVKRGYEVLYLVEPIDEVAVSNLASGFDGKPLMDISKDELQLDAEGDKEAAKAKDDALAGEFKGLTDWMKAILGDKVEKVVVSKRLEGTPCVLATSKFGWSANMERIMRSQALGDAKALEYMKGRKILEVNPASAIVRDLRDRAAAAPGDPAAAEAARLMYETALLTSGFNVDSPADFAARIFAMMGSKLASTPLDKSAPAPQAPAEAVSAELMDEGGDPWKNKM